MYHDPRLMPSAIDKNEDFAIPLEDQPRKSSPEVRGARTPPGGKACMCYGCVPSVLLSSLAPKAA